MAAVEVSDEIAARFAKVLSVDDHVSRAVLEVAGAAIVTDVLTQLIHALKGWDSIYRESGDAALRGMERAINHLEDYRVHTAEQSGMDYDTEPPRVLPPAVAEKFFRIAALASLSQRVYATAHGVPVEHVDPTDKWLNEVFLLLEKEAD
ncbi:MAG: hypothetical protein WC054_00285 [Candidatus Nanopelagicales bacterium]